MISMTPFVARLGRVRTKVSPTLIRFITGNGGQDLVEYALLAAFIGVAGWAVLLTIDNTVGAAYSAWLNPTTGVPSLWQPAEPAGS